MLNLNFYYMRSFIYVFMKPCILFGIGNAHKYFLIPRCHCVVFDENFIVMSLSIKVSGRNSQPRIEFAPIEMGNRKIIVIINYNNSTFRIFKISRTHDKLLIEHAKMKACFIPSSARESINP